MTTLTDWSVAGQLTKVGGHWLYSGIVASSQPGFLKFAMSPTVMPARSTKRQYIQSIELILIATNRRRLFLPRDAKCKA